MNMISLKNCFQLLCPPLIFRFFKEKLNQFEKKKKKYDSRRWWSGEEKNTFGKKFRENFDIGEYQVFYLMLNKEVRETIKIPPKSKIKIKLKSKKLPLNNNLLLSFGIKNFTNSVTGDIEVLINKFMIAQISDLLIDHWNSVFIEKFNLVQNEIEIKNNTNQNLYFACPIVFKKFNDNEKIKNIFLVVLDQVDFSTFNELHETEELCFIKKFFDKGMNFKNFYAAAEWTIPCLESIFTGQHPSSHGFFDLKSSKNLKTKLFEENNIFNYFNNLGFSIFGISRSKGHHVGFDFNEDFDRFIYLEDKGITNISDDTKIAKKTIDHLNLNNEGKNFVFLHYMSSHSPYLKPNIAEEKNLRTHRFVDPSKEYNDAILAYGSSKVEPIMHPAKLDSIILRQKERLKDIDIQIGQLLSFIETKNQKKNTLFILTSDHGPNHFNENNQFIMNKKRLNIPFLIYFSEFQELKKNDKYLSQTDIFQILKDFMSQNKTILNMDLMLSENKDIISESIFSDLYRVSIRNKDHIYYFSCNFDSKKFIINFHEEIVSKLEIINKNKTDNVDILISGYKEKIKRHLLKSKKIKLN
jgi:predicted AlkP superfamily pyrophosphatase or phosphodiesterase